ncbi:hypothetical protein BJ170DRAFT_591485 [Xylariales sp. AK1849]|nr:hypothetical protein BJ170DRAFT_591485 [Xylariales sp. AK1849]
MDYATTFPGNAIQRTARFPFEIWVLVMTSLVNNKDFPDVWLNCRRVSWSFKRATEIAFLSEALPEIEINLSLIGCCGRGKSEVAQLQFRGFSDDGERVHYGETRQDCERLTEAWRSGQSNGLGRSPSTAFDFGNPPILVEWASKIYISVCRGPTSYHMWSEEYRRMLRHVWFKAGSLQAMEMDVHHQRREMSFLWKPLLSKFFKRLGQPSSPKKIAMRDTSVEHD